MSLRNHEMEPNYRLLCLLDDDQNIVENNLSHSLEQSGGELVFLVHPYRTSEWYSLSPEEIHEMQTRKGSVTRVIQNDSRPIVVLDNPEELSTVKQFSGGHNSRFWLSAPIDGSPRLSHDPGINGELYSRVAAILANTGVKKIVYGGQGKGCIAEIQKFIDIPSEIDKRMWSLY